MANAYMVGATLDIGTERERQEDYFRFAELDDDNLFCVLADGSGSREENPRPAAIAVEHVVSGISKVFEEKRDLFLESPEYFLRLYMLSANDVLGAFKFANEELYSGYAASMTCALFSDTSDGTRIYITHSGNTRLSLIRNGQLKDLTTDHTHAMDLVAEGKIDMETYYTHPGILQLTSGIGVMTNPKIQTVKGRLKENDICLMTTDGIHYAIRPEAMAEIVLASNSCENASANLVAAAKDLKYPDNATAVVISRAL